MKIKKQNIFFYFFKLLPYAFFELLPLQIWTSKTCNKDISKTILASSFRFGQRVDYLEKRMSDKLMVWGIVFHKDIF